MERRKNLNIGLRDHSLKTLIPQKIDEINELWKGLFSNFPALKINTFIYMNLGKRTSNEAENWKKTYYNTLCVTVINHIERKTKFRQKGLVTGVHIHHDGNITLYPQANTWGLKKPKFTGTIATPSITPIKTYQYNTNFEDRIRYKLQNPYNIKGLKGYYQDAYKLTTDYKELLEIFDRYIKEHVKKMEPAWIIHSQRRIPMQYPEDFNQMII